MNRRAIPLVLALPALASAMTAPVVLVDCAVGEPSSWYVVNDGVMGGVSEGAVRATGEGTILFAGALSLENNGGFASTRTVVPPRDLREWDGLELRVRGDGRTWQLRLRTDDRFDGVAYRATFPTERDVWTTVQVPFARCEPVFRGRVLDGHPPLDPARIRQVGFLLADKQAGPFALEIARIRTWRDGDAAP